MRESLWDIKPDPSLIANGSLSAMFNDFAYHQKRSLKSRLAAAKQVCQKAIEFTINKHAQISQVTFPVIGLE